MPDTAAEKIKLKKYINFTLFTPKSTDYMFPWVGGY